MKDKFFERLISLLSRKFATVVLINLLSYTLVMAGKMDQGGFVTIALATAGAYIVGNVYEKIKNANGS